MSATSDVRKIEQAVLATYSAYFADFQRLDGAATAAHFTAPLCRVQNGRTTVFATEPDVHEMLRTIWAKLATKDYARSSNTARTITVLDDRSVLLRARGTRYNQFGAPFEHFDVLYTLVRSGGRDEWKIAVIASIRVEH